MSTRPACRSLPVPDVPRLSRRCVLRRLSRRRYSPGLAQAWLAPDKRVSPTWACRARTRPDGLMCDRTAAGVVGLFIGRPFFKRLYEEIG